MRKRWTLGFTAMGIFLLFGTVMAAVAGTTLAWPGTVLDRVWSLNPRAYKELALLGLWVGVGFFLLSAALIAAAIGWFRQQRWGWRLTLIIIAIQMAGDLINFARGDLARGGAGMVIAGLVLAFLLRRKLRTMFA